MTGVNFQSRRSTENHPSTESCDFFFFGCFWYMCSLPLPVSQLRVLSLHYKHRTLLWISLFHCVDCACSGIVAKLSSRMAKLL